MTGYAVRRRVPRGVFTGTTSAVQPEPGGLYENRESCAGLATLASLLAGGSVALASASTPAGGKVKLYVFTPAATRSKVLLTGAIGDAGPSVAIDKNGKVDPPGTFEKFTLKRGGFVLNTSAVAQKLHTTKPTIDSSTCSVDLAVTADVPAIDGTGLYQGIRGKVHIMEDIASIGPRYASRPKSGQCDTSSTAKPVAQFFTGTGAGAIGFS